MPPAAPQTEQLPLRVITDADKTRVTGHNSGTVCMDGPSPDSVSSTAAKRMALQHAATLGISRPGLGVGGGPYVVGPNGETGDPITMANQAGCRYRYDYPIQGGL